MQFASLPVRRALSGLLLSGVVAATLVLASSSARADIIFTLSPASVSGDPGSLIQFAGTLTNDGSSTVFFTGFSLDSLPSFLTSNPDSTVFFNNVPVSIAAGGSYTGPIFGVNIDADAIAGSYVGSVTLLGGGTGDEFSPVATQNLQVVVNNIAPEPHTGNLVMMGMLLALGVSIVRRRRPATVPATI